MGGELPSGVSEVGVTTSNMARIYDYFLGASANLAVGRDVGMKCSRLRRHFRS